MSGLSDMSKLATALADPIWLSHKAGDRYKMDGKGHWTIAYYPILENGKIPENGEREVYDEARALIECPKMFKGEQGIDIREMPLRYLERK